MTDDYELKRAQVREGIKENVALVHIETVLDAVMQTFGYTPEPPTKYKIVHRRCFAFDVIMTIYFDAELHNLVNENGIVDENDIVDWTVDNLEVPLSFDWVREEFLKEHPDGDIQFEFSQYADMGDSIDIEPIRES